MKLLFICTANICRSPMAEAIFNALAADSGLSARAHSAGVEAREGSPVHPNAVTALEEVGISSGRHRARRVREAMIDESNLVLAMNSQHVEELQHLFAEQSHKLHVLPVYADVASGSIPDPYGLTIPAYRTSVRQLSECIERVIEALKKELAPS